MGVEEVETMSTLTIEEPTLGKTMSTSGTLVGTPSTIPSMQGCNTRSCSSGKCVEEPASRHTIEHKVACDASAL